jgi:hypothetical protein
VNKYCLISGFLFFSIVSKQTFTPLKSSLNMNHYGFIHQLLQLEKLHLASGRVGSLCLHLPMNLRYLLGHSLKKFPWAQEVELGLGPLNDC